MRHEYYGYSKEELLANPKISLVFMADNEQVFRHMAGEMAETIEAHNGIYLPCRPGWPVSIFR